MKLPKGALVKAIELVTYLNEREAASIDELTSEFEVSARTVRLHIQRTNEMLEGLAHISYARKQGGYVLSVINEEGFSEWLDRMHRFGDLDGSASDKRVTYLINDLLMRDDWVTVASMAQVLYVSPQSISKDLKAVEAKLGEYDLALEKRPRYGVRVRGSELNRRLCLASIATEGVTGSNPFGDETVPQVVKTIAGCIERALEEHPVYMSMLAFQNLVVHLMVAFYRIKEDCLILLDDETLDRIRLTPEFAAARSVAKQLDGAFGIALPESEVAYIAIHLAGKKSIIPEESAAAGASSAEGGHAGTEGSHGGARGATPHDARGVIIPDEVWNVVTEMLDRVWELFHFDFRDDLELRMNLARHIVPLVTRLRFNMSIDNPLLSDIKTRFPLAFAMALDAADVLGRHYGTTLSQAETGYIALAFALALDRLREEGPRRNVVVVCASGLGTSRLLEHAIRRQFGDRIDKVVPCDALHVEAMDFTGFDYIFTTVPLEGEFPIPVQEIHSFLNEVDVRQINELLRASADMGAGAGLFDPAWFDPHLDAETPHEAICCLAELMVERAGAPAELVELALERESAASTAFGSGLALPHPIRSLPGPAKVCAGIPNRPIRWGDKDVELVLLVAIGDDGRNALDWFFSRMAELLSHEERVKRIVDDRSFEVMMQEIAHGEERN